MFLNIVNIRALSLLVLLAISISWIHSTKATALSRIKRQTLLTTQASLLDNLFLWCDDEIPEDAVKLVKTQGNTFAVFKFWEVTDTHEKEVLRGLRWLICNSLRTAAFNQSLTTVDTAGYMLMTNGSQKSPCTRKSARIKLHRCEELDCKNGGECLQDSASSLAACSCLSGWAGSLCEIPVNPCASLKCANAGICIVNEASGHAWCNYTVDPCASLKCANGGNCVGDKASGHGWCNCTAAWTGARCEMQVDPCASLKCANGGNCDADKASGHGWCNCTAAWTGARCEMQVDPCASLKCANGGNCVADKASGHGWCNCTAAWIGARCETHVDPCASLECANEGNCLVDKGSGRGWCNCTGAWSGAHCNEATSASCRESFTAGPSSLSSNCYYVSTNSEKLNWVQADAYCRKNGSHLVTIHSAEEKDFVLERLRALTANYNSFLGFLPNANKTAWFWIDTFTPLDVKIINWVSGQPDDNNRQCGCGQEWCSNLDGASGGAQRINIVNDYPCQGATPALPFICKYSRGTKQ